jgi:signal recognition particle subunit SRP54
MAAKLRKGQFDLDDLADQLRQMSRMGGMKGLLGMMPGIGKAQMQAAQAHMGDGTIKRQVAIISSMTKDERKDPKVLNASRKKRIAKGSGTEVQEINRLLKMHRQMADMMKAMGRQKGGLMSKLFGGGMPDIPPEVAADPKAMEKLLPQGLPRLGPGGLPGLPGSGFGGMPPGLPGLPSGKKKK